MSYFVTISFDIEDAASSAYGTNVYKRITDDLEELLYSRFVKSRRRNRETQLPSNTYVCEFEDSPEGEASDIKDIVAEELKSVFERYNVHGKCFIAVGNDWSWGVRNF